MTGFIDGCGEIIFLRDGKTPHVDGDCGGKISYLGGTSTRRPCRSRPARRASARGCS